MFSGLPTPPESAVRRNVVTLGVAQRVALWPEWSDTDVATEKWVYIFSF